MWPEAEPNLAFFFSRFLITIYNATRVLHVVHTLGFDILIVRLEHPDTSLRIE